VFNKQERFLVNIRETAQARARKNATYQVFFIGALVEAVLLVVGMLVPTGFETPLGLLMIGVALATGLLMWRAHHRAPHNMELIQKELRDIVANEQMLMNYYEQQLAEYAWRLRNADDFIRELWVIETRKALDQLLPDFLGDLESVEKQQRTAPREVKLRNQTMFLQTAQAIREAREYAVSLKASTLASAPPANLVANFRLSLEKCVAAAEAAVADSRSRIAEARQFL
jgi:uncharacterized integral membrane protein